MQKLGVLCDFVLARATLCGDRRGRGAKTRGFVYDFLRVCLGSRDPLRGSAWSRCKNSWLFFFFFFFFFRFCSGSRDPLRGSAWSRCKNSIVFTIFCDFVLARATLCGDRRGRGAKTRVFFYYFFSILFWLARPSAGIGVVEVQKLAEFLRFLRFCFGSRDPLRGSAWSRCNNSWFLRFCFGSRDPLCDFCCSNWSLGEVRFLPGPQAGFASCTEQ